MSGSENSIELVAIARVVRPRGIKGEVMAEVLTDFPERFGSLESVTAVSDGKSRGSLKIEDLWFQNDRIVLKFAGYDSIEAAEALRNTELCVVESESVELDEGEFFYWQLAGCRVETVDGETIGSVKELMRPGGTELLVVEGTAKEYLIPFAHAICVEVDVDNKLIKIDPPEGLLDF
ncbi:MAG TPA: ribosome maturation factor RimM [Pyrinomonadaceae bacterium]|nr:ribosome maturation factor RimM [Pyrinomonadaceae bacterium]